MVIRMLKNLRETMNGFSGLKQIVGIKEDKETIKKNQPPVKNTVSEIKSTLDGISSRLNEAEDQTVI